MGCFVSLLIACAPKESCTLVSRCFAQHVQACSGHDMCDVLLVLLCVLLQARVQYAGAGFSQLLHHAAGTLPSGGSQGG